MITVEIGDKHGMRLQTEHFDTFEEAGEWADQILDEDPAAAQVYIGRKPSIKLGLLG